MTHAGNSTYCRVNRHGVSVFLDNRQTKRHDAFRSYMAGGIWLGVVAEANLETEEAVFGRRRWVGPSMTSFLAPAAMPSDHFVLDDSRMATLFVHLDSNGMRRFGLDPLRLSSWAGYSISQQDARFDHIMGQTDALLTAPRTHDANTLLLAGQEIAVRMLDRAGLLPDELSEMPAGFPTPDMERLYQARDLLLADLRQPPSIVELARHCGTNARKLTEQFRAVFGLPPFAYLKRYRLEQALDALRRGDRSIAAIADEVGYRPTHLSAAFRARFGRSPRDYRSANSTII